VAQESGKLPADVVAGLIFEMCPVPTPDGVMTGCTVGQGTYQFRYRDGSQSKVYQATEEIQILL